MLNRVAFLFVKDVSDLWYSCYFLFLAVGKLWNQQKNEASRQRWSKKAAVRVDDYKQCRWNRKTERAERVEKPEDAADIIKEYGEILCTNRKGIIVVTFYQGKIFKLFKERKKFQQMVKELKIHKSTIIFKINVFKLIEKYTKLKRSSVTLTFLKNYLKNIKKVCEEHASDFQWVKVICLRKLLKSSLQKCLDKILCKCCKIFKAFVTSRRVNSVLTHFS